MARKRLSKPVSFEDVEPHRLASDENPYLERLAAQLEIDTDNLEEELQRQPELCYRAWREVGRLKAIVFSSATVVKSTRARIDAMIRRASSERSSNISEPDLAHQVNINSEVVNSERKLRDNKAKLYEARAVAKAFGQRADVLMSIVDLKVSG